jgi:hypothetical protein
MARIFKTNIDADGNQIINLVVEKLAADPGSPAEARFIYNTVGKVVKYWNGTAWIIADGSTLDGQAGAYYLARANHTGTQLAATISDFNTAVRLNRLDQLAVPTAAVALNAQKITGLATPTAATDAATKAYAEARANHTGTQLAATISDLSTAVDARIAATGYAADIGNGALTAITVTHNLNTRDVIVRVRSNSTPWAFVEPDIEATDANTVTLRFTTAPTAAQYRALVQAVL